jgi:hypothetical protein
MMIMMIGAILDKVHSYEHVPKSVETGHEGNAIILWNQKVQTDRTIANNKADIIISDNEEETCMLIDAAVSGDKCDEVTSREISKYNTNRARVEWKKKCDTNNNYGIWNQLKIIQKIPVQRTGKARNQGTTENSHIGHCTHT